MRLVLGRYANDGEVFVTGDDPPDAVRADVRALFESEPACGGTICTFSPVAANAYAYAFRHDGGVDYADVFVWDGTRDRCVTEYLSREYMAHFAISDLYAASEFDTLPKGT